MIVACAGILVGRKPFQTPIGVVLARTPAKLLAQNKGREDLFKITLHAVATTMDESMSLLAPALGWNARMTSIWQAQVATGPYKLFSGNGEYRKLGDVSTGNIREGARETADGVAVGVLARRIGVGMSNMALGASITSITGATARLTLPSAKRVPVTCFKRLG